MMSVEKWKKYFLEIDQKLDLLLRLSIKADDKEGGGRGN